MLLMVRNVRLTQKVVVVVVFIAVYVSVVAFPGWCMWKSRLNSITYGSYWHLNLPESKIIIPLDTRNNVRNQFHHDSFLLEDRLNLGKSSNNNIQHSEQSSLNIYFTVKTTPGNYEKRIHPLQISWFQKVNKEMLSIVSDPFNGNISKDSKDQLIEARLLKEGFNIALSNCPVKYGRRTLCCKTGLEFEQYYKYVEKNKGTTNELAQWFCHVDDDVYVNVEQLKKLLLHYDPLKTYYVGRHWRTELGLMVDKGRMNRLKKNYNIGDERRRFWHAAGPTYCISHSLMMELKDFFNGSCRFMNTCDVTMYADDLTVGAIIGVVLGHNITHTTAFDYDRIDLRVLNATAIVKTATINYKFNKESGLIWRSKINPKLRKFSMEEDPSGILSFHCLLYNDTSWCPSNSSNAYKTLGNYVTEIL